MKKDKKVKLTECEKKLLDLMKERKGSFLRPHLTMSDAQCFRLLDKNKNPLTNFQSNTVFSLMAKTDHLHRNEKGEIYYI